MTVGAPTKPPHWLWGTGPSCCLADCAPAAALSPLTGCCYTDPSGLVRSPSHTAPTQISMCTRSVVSGTWTGRSDWLTCVHSLHLILSCFLILALPVSSSRRRSTRPPTNGHTRAYRHPSSASGATPMYGAHLPLPCNWLCRDLVTQLKQLVLSLQRQVPANGFPGISVDPRRGVQPSAYLGCPPLPWGFRVP